MDYRAICGFFFFLYACIRLLTTNFNRQKSGTFVLPPGPTPFPIIGNILEIGHSPHQSLAKLSKIYGPLMSLKLGSITTIVVSSPKFAKEVLHKHDLALSSHAMVYSGQVYDHHKFSIAAMPVGANWRNLRKICKEQMLSTGQLDASQALRIKKIQELIDYVHECAICGDQAVDIGAATFTTALNLISNTFFSIDLADHNSSSSQEIKEAVWGVFEVVGKPDLATYFPVLRFIDPQGTWRKAKISFGKLLRIFEGIIDQRLQSKGSSGDCLMSSDVLDGLLDLSQKNGTEFSYNAIKHLLLDLFIAGTDTASSTIEWAMAELLQNPEKMAKARMELNEVVGKEGLLQESSIPKLPYLQAIVKETFRLHPVAPFLIPHQAEEDVEIEGYIVPKNAHILVNAWAIGRDSSVWSKPDSFMPERFLDCEVDFRGHDYELIPFGSGRRICPGLPLAHRMVHLMLGSMLCSFDWKLEEGMEGDKMDMSEKFGLALHKAIPLKAIPIKV